MFEILIIDITEFISTHHFLVAVSMAVSSCEGATTCWASTAKLKQSPTLKSAEKFDDIYIFDLMLSDLVVI